MCPLEDFMRRERCTFAIVINIARRKQHPERPFSFLLFPMLHPLPHPCALPPERFTYPFAYTPHPLVEQAANEVMRYLEVRAQESAEWAEGKMFGVLIVEDAQGEVGFLAGYSGLLLGRNDLPYFVPAVYDFLHPGSYFKERDAEISAVNRKVDALEHDEDFRAARLQLQELNTEAQREIASYQLLMQEEKRKRNERRLAGNLSAEEEAELIRQSQYFKGNFSRLKKQYRERIVEAETKVRIYENKLNALCEERRRMSDALQTWIFEQFQMLNIRGERKNLVEIFAETPQGVPPAGAGECALPKLLQFAFTHGLRPLCFGEFWWGASPRNEVRTEGQFYPSCLSKCKPILGHMLNGLSLDPNPIEALQRSVEDQLAIIYEDEHLVAVNKPSGMLSVPGLTGVPSAFELLQAERPELMVVHRLDMATSGVLVFAKTKEAHYELQRQFAEREAKKRYIADVAGRISKESGLISLPLRLDPLNRPRQVVDHKDGKPAVTHFKKLGEHETPNGTITRLALSPQTGRTHQLRLHCAHTEGLGTPIVGDELYGTKADRLHLHAELLVVRHPATGRSLRLTAEAQGM